MCTLDFSSIELIFVVYVVQRCGLRLNVNFSMNDLYFRSSSRSNTTLCERAAARRLCNSIVNSGVHTFLDKMSFYCVIVSCQHHSFTYFTCQLPVCSIWTNKRMNLENVTRTASSVMAVCFDSRPRLAMRDVTRLVSDQIKETGLREKLGK